MAVRLSDVYVREISRALDALCDPGEEVVFDVIPAVSKSATVAIFVPMWMQSKISDQTFQFTASFREETGHPIPQQLDEFVKVCLGQLRGMRVTEITGR